MTNKTDVLIIGAGIAGASAGYFLAGDGVRVAVLEREDQPGYHSTGRSAALFSETYGPTMVRKLSTATRTFLTEPPEGFAEHPILTPRGMLVMGGPDDIAKVDNLVREGRANGAAVERLDAQQLREIVPILRDGVFVAGAHEPAAMDMDVHALHQGFLRGLKRNGGRIETDAEITGLERAGDVWRATTRRGDVWEAAVVVNAAGAWADHVAEMAGVRRLGLTPKRRTAIMIDPPAGTDVNGFPMTTDVDETFYFKPDAGRLLLSPADATPVPAQDIQPEELDIAIAIDRFMSATTVEVRRPGESWAGLRSFVADGEPAAGYAPDADGFFWLAGQGGYGIQTSAAMGRLAAALVQKQPVPDDIAKLGLTAADIAPGRAGLGV